MSAEGRRTKFWILTQGMAVRLFILEGSMGENALQHVKKKKSIVLEMLLFKGKEQRKVWFVFNF